MYIILTVSWNIFSGYTGYISLAHSALFGIGGFISVFTTSFLPLPLPFILGGATSAFIGFLVGLLTLRLKGLYFTIFSFAISLLAYNFFSFIVFGRARTAGVYIKVLPDTLIYYSLLAVLLIIIVISIWLIRSRYGEAIMAIGQDELKAETIGINATFWKVMIFVLSSIFVGLTGAISAQRYLYIDPQTAFNLRTTFEPITMAIVGGTGTFLGPIIGAILLTIIEELLAVRVPYYYFLLLGILLLVFLLFLKEGIIGILQSVRFPRKRPQSNTSGT
jgi:branched-chain amino acid transport system permease protein